MKKIKKDKISIYLIVCMAIDAFLAVLFCGLYVHDSLDPYAKDGLIEMFAAIVCVAWLLVSFMAYIFYKRGSEVIFISLLAKFSLAFSGFTLAIITANENRSKEAATVPGTLAVLSCLTVCFMIFNRLRGRKKQANNNE